MGALSAILGAGRRRKRKETPSAAAPLFPLRSLAERPSVEKLAAIRDAAFRTRMEALRLEVEGAGGDPSNSCAASPAFSIWSAAIVAPGDIARARRTRAPVPQGDRDAGDHALAAMKAEFDADAPEGGVTQVKQEGNWVRRGARRGATPHVWSMFH